jgi:hypothetical protein
LRPACLDAAPASPAVRGSRDIAQPELGIEEGHKPHQRVQVELMPLLLQKFRWQGVHLAIPLGPAALARQDQPPGGGGSLLGFPGGDDGAVGRLDAPLSEERNIPSRKMYARFSVPGEGSGGPQPRRPPCASIARASSRAGDCWADNARGKAKVAREVLRSGITWVAPAGR